jgi:hypothetical protein
VRATGDVVLGDRAVEVALVVARAGEGELEALELADERLALRAEGGEVLLGLGTLLGELGEDLVAGRGRELAREQVVTGVADADVDHIANDPEVVDILGEQELDGTGHEGPPFAVLPRPGAGGELRSRSASAPTA